MANQDKYFQKDFEDKAWSDMAVLLDASMPPQQDKKRRFFWWWSALGLIAIIGILWYVTSDVSGKQGIQTEVVDSENIMDAPSSSQKKNLNNTEDKDAEEVETLQQFATIDVSKKLEENKALSSSLYSDNKRVSDDASSRLENSASEKIIENNLNRNRGIETSITELQIEEEVVNNFLNIHQEKNKTEDFKSSENVKNPVTSADGVLMTDATAEVSSREDRARVSISSLPFIQNRTLLWDEDVWSIDALPVSLDLHPEIDRSQRNSGLYLALTGELQFSPSATGIALHVGKVSSVSSRWDWDNSAGYALDKYYRGGLGNGSQAFAIAEPGVENLSQDLNAVGSGILSGAHRLITDIHSLELNSSMMYRLSPRWRIGLGVTGEYILSAKSDYALTTEQDIEGNNIRQIVAQENGGLNLFRDVDALNRTSLSSRFLVDYHLGKWSIGAAYRRGLSSRIKRDYLGGESRFARRSYELSVRRFI